jgi:RNase P/RNase MRP subunit POP5
MDRSWPFIDQLDVAYQNSTQNIQRNNMVKFKNRYLLLRITPADDRTFTWSQLKRAFAQSLADVHGDVGASAAMHTLSVKVSGCARACTCQCTGVHGAHKRVRSTHTT